jgi:hypothetical protein
MRNFIVPEQPVPARQRNAELTKFITAGHSVANQQRRSPDRDPDLTRAGLRRLGVLKAQDVGRVAVVVEAKGAHRGLLG